MTPLLISNHIAYVMGYVCSLHYLTIISTLIQPYFLFGLLSFQFSSVQLLSHVELFTTPQTAAHQASLSLTNSWSLLKLMSVQPMMPPYSLILCHPLLLLPSIFLSIRVFTSESVLHVRWPKYWSFSFSIHPSNEYSGLISFSIDWFDLLSVQGTLKNPPTPQLKSINPSVLSFLYNPTLTSIHDYWKNHCFDQINLCQQSTASGFSYAVQVGHRFSSKKHASFNFMTSVTICSDFGAQENKSVKSRCTCSLGPWVLGGV